MTRQVRASKTQEMVYELKKKNRKWHIVDTTNKSVEETAREIIAMVFGEKHEY